MQLLAACLLALGAVNEIHASYIQITPTSSAPYRVCTVLEQGFTWRKNTASTSVVVSDNDLEGFDVELRQKLLTEELGWNYNVTLIDSIDELIARTRNGECDLGWSPVPVLSKLDVCSIDDERFTDYKYPNNWPHTPGRNLECKKFPLPESFVPTLNSDMQDGDPLVPWIRNYYMAWGSQSLNGQAWQLKNKKPSLGVYGPLNGTYFTDTAASHGWEAYHCCIDYLPISPYYNALGIAYREQVDGFMDAILAAFLKPFLLNFLCFFALSIIIVGHLSWLVERPHNPEFGGQGSTYSEGLDDGVWFAAVTATTVGYGDKSPMTPIGRAVSLVWMFIGVVFCGVITGFIASEFQAATEPLMVERLSDLEGLNVCSTADYFALDDVLKVTGINKTIGDMISCGEELKHGRVDAILYDEVRIFHYIQTNQWMQVDVRVTTGMVGRPVAIIYPESSRIWLTEDRYGKDLTRKMQELVINEQSLLATIYNKWFGYYKLHMDKSNVIRSAQDSFDMTYIGPFLGYAGFFLLVQLFRAFKLSLAQKTALEQQSSEKDTYPDGPRKGSLTRTISMVKTTSSAMVTTGKLLVSGADETRMDHGYRGVEMATMAETTDEIKRLEQLVSSSLEKIEELKNATQEGGQGRAEAAGAARHMANMGAPFEENSGLGGTVLVQPKSIGVF